MGSLDQLKYLRKIKARANHQCSQCGEIILIGEYYYRETIEDRFLHSLHARSFCTKCYTQSGNSLLTTKSKEKRETTQNEKTET